MLKSLEINNFRCFEKFELPQLGRVNLLVGKNNSGKTSILEAVHILGSGDFSSFLAASKRRNEEDDIVHFCHGHSIGRMSIFSTTENANALFEFHEDEIYIDSFKPFLKWQNIGGKVGRSNSTRVNSPIKETYWQVSQGNNIFFVSIESLNITNTVDLFNKIVITPKEEILYEALRFVEPDIIRVAPIKDENFMVQLNSQRVPIGSMGDGIQRMLAITLAMVNVPGGILLIDEIDTGLHFSVMVDLWRLICKTAEKLDIQVFATTHSSDCWKSLAEVAQSKEFPNSDITIHRIEKDKKASVMFNEKEMAIAAQRDIEVR